MKPFFCGQKLCLKTSDFCVTANVKGTSHCRPTNWRMEKFTGTKWIEVLVYFYFVDRFLHIFFEKAFHCWTQSNAAEINKKCWCKVKYENKTEWNSVEKYHFSIFHARRRIKCSFLFVRNNRKVKETAEASIAQKIKKEITKKRENQKAENTEQANEWTRDLIWHFSFLLFSLLWLMCGDDEIPLNEK